MYNYIYKKKFNFFKSNFNKKQQNRVTLKLKSIITLKKTIQLLVKKFKFQLPLKKQYLS